MEQNLHPLDVHTLNKSDAVAAMKLPSNIHLAPLDFIECNGVTYSIRPGFYEINGATAIPGGVNFTVHSNGATAVSLLLSRAQRQRRKDRKGTTVPRLHFPKRYQQERTP